MTQQALAVIATALLLAPAPAAQQPDTVREIEVSMRQGRLDVADLARALLDAYGFDGDALALPEQEVDLSGIRGYALLLGVRKALRGTVQFTRAGDGSALTIRVDRVRARELRRELRAKLASWLGRLAGEQVAERHYELQLPSQLDPERPLVLLLHGVESTPEVFAELRAFLATHEPAPQIATFAYPNDDAVERIAVELAEALRALGEQRVAIVGYSLGGLIGRAVVEDPELDPGNVAMLIQIGTPNAGSNLGGLRFLRDAAHLVERREEPESLGRLLLANACDNLRDGLGEAGGDLLPGSVLQQRLAAAHRNEDVEYRLLLGTRSLLTDAQRDALRARLDDLLEELPDDAALARALRPKLLAWVADLDELVHGAGDGAVSIERGRLAGVEPVLVPLDHVGLVRERGLLGASTPAAEHPGLRQVAAWLAELR